MGYKRRKNSPVSEHIWLESCKRLSLRVKILKAWAMSLEIFGCADLCWKENPNRPSIHLKAMKFDLG